jgi:hypothetical protein
MLLSDKLPIGRKKKIRKCKNWILFFFHFTQNERRRIRNPKNKKSGLKESIFIPWFWNVPVRIWDRFYRVMIRPLFVMRGLKN